MVRTLLILSFSLAPLLLSGCPTPIDVRQETIVNVDKAFLESLLDRESRSKVDEDTRKELLLPIENSINGLRDKNFDLFARAFLFDREDARDIYERLLPQDIQYKIDSVSFTEVESQRAVVNVRRVTVNRQRLNTEGDAIDVQNFDYVLQPVDGEWKIAMIL